MTTPTPTPTPIPTPEPEKKQSSTTKKIVWAIVGGLLVGGAIGSLGGGTGNEAPSTPPVVETPASKSTPTPTPTPTSGQLTPEQQKVALQLAWEQQTPEDQTAVCDGVDLFGASIAADIMLSETDGQFDHDIAEQFLIETCE